MKYVLLLLFSLAVLSLSASFAAADSFWRSAGARGGWSDASDGCIYEYELFAVYQLPWELRNRSGWGVSTNLDVSAGALTDNKETGFIGSFGPYFAVGRTGLPLALNLGASLGLLSRDKFGTRDLNGYAQFISHAGLDYRISERVGVGYRFQHISNARMNGHRNPGDNLHLLAVEWYLEQHR